MNSANDFPWDWVHVTQNTLVRMSQGVLHTIVINQSDDKGLCTVWDGTALIASITTDFDQPRTLIFDLEFHTALTVVVVGTWDLTVTYK